MSQINITISEDKLKQLMEIGVLSASEITSEDFSVKQLIQAMCLKSCSNKLCANCSFSDLCGTAIMGSSTAYISSEEITTSV